MNTFIQNIEKVIMETGIDPFLPHRSKTRILLRQAIYLKLRNKGLSYPEIGEIFKKDHTTILHSIKNMRPNNPFFEIVNRLM